MMKEEFERIANYEVSDDDYYKILEPMYMALPNGITKENFVAMINKKRFALRSTLMIIKEMRATAKEIQANCTHFTDSENNEKLENLINEYIDQKNWKGLVDYIVYHGEKFSCYYPNRIEIYDKKSYKTYQKIDLM